METLDYNFNTADIKISKISLITIYNSLNELCAGINISDCQFEKCLFTSREIVCNLRDEFGEIITKMKQLTSENNELKKATYLDNDWLLCPYCIDSWKSSIQSEKIVNCKNCRKDSYNPRYRAENSIKFKIDYEDKKEDRLLLYVMNDYSFTVEPIIPKIYFELIINKIILAVSDDNRIVQIWGFCPSPLWIETQENVPDSKEGSLIVDADLEPGYSYGIYGDDCEQPMFFNYSTGWVCIGNPKIKGSTVEFFNNAVAVISGTHLIALWLKPKFVESYNEINLDS